MDLFGCTFHDPLADQGRGIRDLEHDYYYDSLVGGHPECCQVDRYRVAKESFGQWSAFLVRSIFLLRSLCRGNRYDPSRVVGLGLVYHVARPFNLVEPLCYSGR